MENDDPRYGDDSPRLPDGPEPVSRDLVDKHILEATVGEMLQSVYSDISLSGEQPQSRSEDAKAALGEKWLRVQVRDEDSGGWSWRKVRVLGHVVSELKSCSECNPFFPKKLVDDIGKMVICPGRLVEVHASYIPSNPFHAYDPDIGGNPMSAEPEITVSAGQTAMLHFTTDEDGTIDSSSPEIVVKASWPDCVHHYPNDPDESGNPGDYYFPLFKVLSTNDPDCGLKYETYFGGGHIFWPKMLWRGVNLGGASRPFIRHNEDDDQWEFRTIKGNYGIEDAEDGDRIKLDADLENATSGEAEVYIEQAAPLPDGPAKFHELSGRVSGDPGDSGVTKQVNVLPGDAAANKPVRIEGNGKVGSITFQDCDGNVLVTLSWNDGLITISGDTTIETGCDGGSSGGTP